MFTKKTLQLSHFFGQKIHSFALRILAGSLATSLRLPEAAEEAGAAEEHGVAGGERFWEFLFGWFT